MPGSLPQLSRRAALLLAAAAAAGCAADSGEPGPEPPAAPPPEIPLPVGVPRDASPAFRATSDAVVAAMREFRIPGGALGILAGNREQHATFGVSSLSSLRPVAPDTLFQIGSLTKTFTATAIWKLIDDGDLALDGRVRRYLRGLRLRDPQTAEVVTVANLLEHTCGWYGDGLFDTGDDSDALGRYVEEHLPQFPQQFECGRYFSYNNSAFLLLGRLIEIVANTDYADAVGRLVLSPLRLADTVFDRGAVLRRPYADGHIATAVNGRPSVAVQTPLWVPRSVDPAGGLWSTTRDVLRYARLHLGAEPPRRAVGITSASLRAMAEPAVGVPGLDLSMGRSWFVQEVGDLRVISHDGDTLGQHTTFAAVPARGFALVLLLNGQPGSAAAKSVLDAALTGYPGLGELAGRAGIGGALLVAAAGTGTRPGGDELGAYAGRYSDPGGTLTLEVDGGGLVSSEETTPEAGSWQPDISPPPPQPEAVEVIGPDSAVRDGMRLPFVRRDDGTVGWVATGLRLRPRTGRR